ncbi:MAG: flagellar biosynthesis anti-sigma factor FlgM [Deltaproteobacteria bacterium]|nr:flagellar biosynthesis anti-sigma factor FlgM [Deltaproteobacteria bacterium]
MEINKFESGTKVNRYQGDAKTSLEEAKGEKQADQTTNLKEPSEDRVEISVRSREIARAKELAESAPAVRQEKVEAVKAQLAAGTYQINSEDVAEKIIKESLSELV